MADNLANTPTLGVNYITFNQDASCVAIGVNNGYRIYSCKSEFGKRFVLDRGEAIVIVEMLYSTSLLAVVALGEEPGALPRKLKIINTKRQATICDLVFPSTILLVRLGVKRMVVLLESQIYIYDVATMLLLHTIETSPNTNRLCALSNNTDKNGIALLAYPLPPKTITHDSLLVNGINTNGGSNSAQSNIQSVSNAPNRVGDAIIFDLISLQPLAVIEAHKAALSAMCLSNDGALLATASNKGTIVRVFNVHTGVKLYQFRRGTYPTKIYSLAFSSDNRYVVATSSSGTVHIFRLGEEELLANKQWQKREAREKNLKGHETIAEETSHDNENDNDNDNDNENDNDVDNNGNDGADADSDGGVSNVPTKQRKLSQSSATSGASVMSGVTSDDYRERTEPIVDLTRLSMARIIRRSSQTLGRKAAQRMGDLLPSRFSSILEPTRHFASLKIQSIGKDVKSIAMLDVELHTEHVSLAHLASRDSPDADLRPVASSGSSSSIKDGLPSNLLHINVVTSEGYFYTYGLDPERGGDCILLHQYSLLDA
ncbi:WD40 repeat-like protein [Metschnikowia bicuspidata]|uniref:WD40 repeat-like protein n=1 Tax=Metschnikowia bicuspidata TaxID=27322 RepID=A0A4P9ZAE3_9ASCO|nr:WD40 repeat-like protein [Metschnikowia bicuspidata]